jgi:very-short-patch-repair endonuclease
MKECSISDIGRHLSTEEVKWFIYSFYFEHKINAIDYVELIKKSSLINILKQSGLYKITGARTTKKTLIDENLERFILLKINAKEMAHSLTNLSQMDYNIHVNNSKYQRNENVYLGLLSKILENICDYELQYVIEPYRIDFYIPEYKIAVEFDEAEHFTNELKIKDDFIRELIIESRLGCVFYRIDERKDVLPQIDHIAQSIIKRITGFEPNLSGRFIHEKCTDTILDLVKDFDLYFTERNKAAIGESKLIISHHEKFKILELEEKMAFAVDMGYITSFNMLIDELRKLWSSEPRSQSGLLSECVTNQE